MPENLPFIATLQQCSKLPAKNELTNSRRTAADQQGRIGVTIILEYVFGMDKVIRQIGSDSCTEVDIARDPFLDASLESVWHPQNIASSKGVAQSLRESEGNVPLSRLAAHLGIMARTERYAAECSTGTGGLVKLRNDSSVRPLSAGYITGMGRKG